MKTYGFTIALRSKDAARRYEAMHRSVWPEVHDALDQIGVRSVQIFVIDDLTLFMHMETEDDFEPESSFGQAMGLHRRVQTWDDIMHKELLQRHPNNAGPTEWADMRKLYHYDIRGIDISTGVDE